MPYESARPLVLSVIQTHKYKLYFVLAGLNKIRVLENVISFNIHHALS